MCTLRYISKSADMSMYILICTNVYASMYANVYSEVLYQYMQRKLPSYMLMYAILYLDVLHQCKISTQILSTKVAV